MTQSKRQIVLLVDPEPMNIHVLAEALMPYQKALVATSGEEALEIVGGPTLPDLVLTNTELPGMDGYELCRRLKASPETGHLPIILIADELSGDAERQGFEAGASDYVTKPFNLVVVQARIKTHLELKRHRDMLHYLSTLDGLTGIPNRRYFDELLEREWRRMLRKKNFLALMLIDLDYFEAYNQCYGRADGDGCLITVAKTVEELFRRSADFVARFDNQVFAVVLPETDGRSALHMGETIRKKIDLMAIPHEASGGAPRLTISVGVVSIKPCQSLEPDAIIKYAECAVSRAKANGRNRVEFFIDVKEE